MVQMESRGQIRPLMPENGAFLPSLAPRLRDVRRNGHRLADDRLDIGDLRAATQQGEEILLPEPVSFRWDGGDAASYTLLLATKPDLSDAVRLPAKKDGIVFPNPAVGTRYYWRVEAADGIVSPIRHFTLEDVPPRLLRLPGMPVVRDLGGYTTKSRTRIRQGMIFRGSPMPPERLAAVREQLSVHTVLSLCADGEGGECPSFAFPAYADLFSEAGRRVCREVFALLAREESYPLYLCGRDGEHRAATLAFLILGILGLRRRDVLEDYELGTLLSPPLCPVEAEPFAGFLHTLEQYPGPYLMEQCRSFLLSIGVTMEELTQIRRILLEHHAPTLHLLSPVDGARDVPLLHPALRRCLLHGDRHPDGRADFTALTKDGLDESQPQPVSFRWECDEAANEYTLYLAQKPELSDARRYTAGADGIDLWNLLPGVTYYWFITANAEDYRTSEVWSFTTEALLPRTIRAPRAANIRDLGGRTGRDGRIVRFGRLFRGSQLEGESELTEEGCRVLRDELGIRCEIGCAICISRWNRILNSWKIPCGRQRCGFSACWRILRPIRCISTATSARIEPERLLF